MEPVFQILGNIKTHILNPIASLIVAFSFFYFLWGVYDVVASKDNKDQFTRGTETIKWGLVGMFFVVSAFGVINFICSSLNCR